MCGIGGIVALLPEAEPPELDALLRMVAALRHRGPDGSGTYRDPRGGLAHTRLSIIDLTTGQQPLSNEDGNLWVSFNGEIFNYVELRQELIQAGHRFKTKSDTEVLVHGWEQWGPGLFGRLNGQWAVALWDSREQTLVLSRDPVGILPLYYREAAGRVQFASEIKALFAADPGLPREFDPVGLAQVFTFWSTVPPQTVFRGVRELEPGCTRIYRRGAVSQEAHFEHRFPPQVERFAGPLEEAARRVRAALERATELRITRSDVPVGSYLSGGLDSSLIAALGRRHAGARFATFSLRFEDAEYDETGFQRLVSAQLSTDHRELVVRRRDIAEAFPLAVRHAERPFLRSAPVPMLLLSRFVRENGTKVVLTGEGADEMFAGYDLFREGRVRRFWARRPESAFRPRLLERLYPHLARSPVAQVAIAKQFFGRNLDRARLPGFAHDPRWRSTSALQRFFSAPLQESLRGRDVAAELLAALPGHFSSFTPLAQDQVLENRTLLSSYLLTVQGDRMLMGNAVEGRFPFLDPDVMALAATLPDEFKLRGLDEKHVLKLLGRGVIPDEILGRSKQPYRAPDALSFAGSGGPAWVEERLSPAAIAKAGVFQPALVAALADKLRRRASEEQFSNADNMAAVGVLSTQLLHEQFIAQPPPRDPDPAPGVRIDRSSL
jgi:asparagine synthase (glutamine-hydrolysing)